MTTATTSNLGDLLKVGDEEEETNNSLRRESVTLATVLGYDEPDSSISSTTPTITSVAIAAAANNTSTTPSRAKTLLDIIRDEIDPPPSLTIHRGPHRHQNGGNISVCWRSVRNRLCLRRISTAWPSHTTSSLSINSNGPIIGVRGESTSVWGTGAVAIVETPTVIATGPSSERPVSEVQASGHAGQRTLTEEPIRASLMELFEQSEGLESGGNDANNLHGTSVFATAMIGIVEEEEEEEEEESEFMDDNNNKMTATKDDSNLCCICMVRQKGAAFIPCGHTFCRPCSKDLWVGRGNCPLCKSFILEILDIF